MSILGVIGKNVLRFSDAKLFLSHYPCSRGNISATKRARDLRMAPLEASGSWLYINFRFSENLEQSSMRYLRLKIRDHIRRICETKVVKSSSSCEHTKIAIVLSNFHQFGTSKQMLFNVRIE